MHFTIQRAAILTSSPQLFRDPTHQRHVPAYNPIPSCHLVLTAFLSFKNSYKSAGPGTDYALVSTEQLTEAELAVTA